MASVSSSAARSLIRDGKSAVNLLLRVRTANLTETMQNNGPAFRSLLRFNQTPASQFPVFPKTFPVMQSGLRVGVVQQEDVSERIGKMEAAHGKGVADNEDADSEEEETDFDEDEIDDVDIDDDDEFEDIDEDDDEEEEDDKYTKKKK